HVMPHRKPTKATFSWTIAGAIVAVLGTSLLIAGKPPATSAATYKFTDLGGLGGFSSVQSEARAVSNVDASGLVTIVGYSSTSTPHEFRPAEWTVNTAGLV